MQIKLIFMWMKIGLNMKGWALRVALKKRPKEFGNGLLRVERNSPLVWFCFVLLHSVIGWQSSCHFFIQWEAKPKLIASCMARIFPRLAPVAFNYFKFWLVYWAVFVSCDWSELLLLFWSYNTQLKTTLWNVKTQSKIKNVVVKIHSGNMHFFSEYVLELWEHCIIITIFVWPRKRRSSVVRRHKE